MQDTKADEYLPRPLERGRTPLWTQTLPAPRGNQRVADDEAQDKLLEPLSRRYAEPSDLYPNLSVIWFGTGL